MRYKPLSPIQKCPQRKALVTSELSRGAFTQPHMGAFMQAHRQLDPPGSLFLSNTKYIPSRHGRRPKNRAPEKCFRAPFAHPKVPPEEAPLGSSDVPKSFLWGHFWMGERGL
uniref:Uncharacterized protein n=1 Tax=Anas platyrhynchos platyrhynchos TaxID=8840 RepID=A0A493TDA6_ANAPP